MSIMKEIGSIPHSLGYHYRLYRKYDAYYYRTLYKIEREPYCKRLTKRQSKRLQMLLKKKAKHVIRYEMFLER